MKVAGLDVLRWDAGWRNDHFLDLTTDESLGSPGGLLHYRQP